LDPTGPGEGDLTYLGASPSSYLPYYEKKTNQEENDYSDLIALTNAFTNTPNATFAGVIATFIDVDEWLRYFAVETVLNNHDGAIATDSGEDYFIYHRPAPVNRWVIIPWDQNENFQAPTEGVYRMGLASVRRLVLHPDFVGRYLGYVTSLLDGAFSVPVMEQRIDSVRGVFPATALSDIAAFVPVRHTTLRALVPEA